MKRVIVVLMSVCLMLPGIILPVQSSPGPADDELVIIGRGSVNALEWSKDGKHLAIGTPYGIWIYNDRLEEVSTIPGTNASLTPIVSDIRWNSAGDKMLVYYSGYDLEDNPVDNAVIWDIDQQKILASTALQELPSSTSWNPSQDYLLTQVGTEVRLLSIEENELVHENTLSFENRIRSVMWSPDGQYISVSVGGEEVQVWDAQLEQTVATFSYPEQTGDFWRLRWSRVSDKPQLILWSNEKVFVLDVESGESSTYVIGTSFSYNFHESNDYNDKIAYETDDDAIEVLDLQTGDAFRLERHDDTITSMVWGPQNYLASGSSGGDIFVWDTQTQELVWSLDWAVEESAKLVWQPGTFLTIVTADQLVHFIDVENKTILKTLHDYNPRLRSVEWSQDSNYLVASSGGDFLETETRTQVWNVKTGELVLGVEQPWQTEYPLSNPIRFTYCCADNLDPPRIFWSENGERYLVLDGPDAQLWDALNNRLIRTVPDVDCIMSVSAGLNYFITCRDQIWNKNTGQIIDEIDRTTEFTWHPVKETYAVTGEYNPEEDAFEIEVIDADSQEQESTLFFPATISDTALTLSNTLASEFSWSHDGSLFIQVRTFMTAPLYFYAVLDAQTNTILATGEGMFGDLEWHPSELIVASPHLRDDWLFIEIYEMPSIKLLSTFEVLRITGVWNSIVGLRWSPNGQYLAIAQYGGIVSVKENPVS